MNKSILLICGHKNIENITARGLRKWRSWSSLKKSTGAAGERDWVWDKLLPFLRDRLIAKGYQIFITDAIYHEETFNRDYDLCLALHYDVGGTDSRCIASKPRQTIDPPFINPEASLLSDQFLSCWTSIYPNRTGIALRQDRITEGMTDYYAWDYIKENTPSVIIEHGNNNCDFDHDKMHNHPDLIADADIEAIEKFFAPLPSQPSEAGDDVALKEYKEFIEKLIEVSRPEPDKKTLPELLGRVESLRIVADNHKNFVKKVAEAIRCSPEEESAVLKHLATLQAQKNEEILNIKKAKLLEFSKTDLLIGLVYKILHRL